MTQKLLFTGLFVLSVMIIGCAQEQLCKAPYIEYKIGECCLDTNSNNICDNDETVPVEITFQENVTDSNETAEMIINEPEEICDLKILSNPKCIEDNEKVYLKQEFIGVDCNNFEYVYDECKDNQECEEFVGLGCWPPPKIGGARIECHSDSECPSTEKCFGGLCSTVDCTGLDGMYRCDNPQLHQCVDGKWKFFKMCNQLLGKTGICNQKIGDNYFDLCKNG